MAVTRRRHPADVSGVRLDGARVTVTVPDRRRHRSRLPATMALVVFLAGTIIADATMLSVLGDSLARTALGVGSLSDPASWWTVLVALANPSVALASIAIGGFPGALTGHTWAVRRLRRDRLDGLVTERHPR